MEDDRLKILYIAGLGRSGSTILGAILGQIDGFFFVGELRAIGEPGRLSQRLCGCRARLSECGFWKRVLHATDGEDGDAGLSVMRRARQLTRTFHLPLMFLPGGTRWLATRLGRDRDHLAALYGTIRRHAGCRIIIDSSKMPIYGALLGQVPGLEVYTILLVRDSRAVAYSWSKKEPVVDGPPGQLRKRYGPAGSAIRWALWNLAGEALARSTPGRSMLLRYEDLIDAPHEAVDRILTFLDENTSASPVRQRTLELRPHHTVGGSRVRFHVGPVELRLDNEWAERMARAHRRLVTILTWAVLKRYGYPTNGIGKTGLVGPPWILPW